MTTTTHEVHEVEVSAHDPWNGDYWGRPEEVINLAKLLNPDAVVTHLGNGIYNVQLPKKYEYKYIILWNNRHSGLDVFTHESDLKAEGALREFMKSRGYDVIETNDGESLDIRDISTDADYLNTCYVGEFTEFK